MPGSLWPYHRLPAQPTSQAQRDLALPYFPGTIGASRPETKRGIEREESLAGADGNRLQTGEPHIIFPKNPARNNTQSIHRRARIWDCDRFGLAVVDRRQALTPHRSLLLPGQTERQFCCRREKTKVRGHLPYRW